MNVYLNKFMVYFEIHRLHRDGLSIRQISKELVINRRTVSRYLSMSELEFEQMAIDQSDRVKALTPFEPFVKSQLEKFRDTSAAQMHDWLKEHFQELPKVSPKTVFNYVSWIRRRHNLPFIKPPREYEMVEELPYGKQAQVDFGEYNMRNPSGNRVKVFFFIIVLSRSRFKYIWFTDRYFTSQLAVDAHEKHLPTSMEFQWKLSMIRIRYSWSAKTVETSFSPKPSDPTHGNSPSAFISVGKPIRKARERSKTWSGMSKEIFFTTAPSTMSKPSTKRH